MRECAWEFTSIGGTTMCPSTIRMTYSHVQSICMESQSHAFAVHSIGFTIADCLGYSMNVYVL